jgi:hypothetical protein
MKKKILFIAFIALTSSFASYGQLMTFGFIKNCMTYARTTMTDELNKKHIVLMDRNVKNAANKLLEGSTYYSNEKDLSKGEIKVLSQINGPKQITEISFISGTNDYSKNFNDVYNQMVAFFKDERTFKSSRYKSDIKMFAKDKVYYYTFENNKVPVIVVSNYKIDDDYFEAK